MILAVESPAAVSAVLTLATSVPTFAATVDVALTTHATGLGADAHLVTSLPPMDTVTRPTLPGLAAMKATAAATWVVGPQGTRRQAAARPPPPPRGRPRYTT